MTYLGTRPPTVDEWDKYELHHRARLATKPGLTGMWQVSGRSNITDFVDKNKRGESSIYTLADIRARSDASFSKDYLYGKYGAIPVIRDYEEEVKEMVGEWTWED